MVKTRAQRKAENSVPPEFEQEDDEPEIGLDFRTKKLCDLVFGIDLLRETIIDFVIHDHNDPQTLSKQNALSCRLVQKSWLESVFKCLVKSGKSLVNVGLHGRSIKSFFNIYDPSSPLPFKYTTWFTTGAVQRDLAKCLKFFNNGLVELALKRYPDKYDSYLEGKPLKGLIRQNFTLPKLRKLNYSVKTRGNLPNWDTKNNDIDINFLPQSILSGSSNLKYFEFSFTDESIYRYTEFPAAAEAFGNLLLPSTIKNLEIDCKPGTHHLEPLLKINNLSNLTDLTIDMPHVPSGDSEWFSRVLNQVSYTLKNLTISECAFFSGEEEITTIDPPVMKSLKRIFIKTPNFEWADGITDLHLKLPTLEKLYLARVRSCSLKKWANNSKFDLLTDLGIFFCNLGRPEGSLLTIENAQLMSKAFLNVTQLKISLTFVDNTDKALQCLFQNMTQLQVLTIGLWEVQRHAVPARYLDALLLGISCKLIDTLKAECAPAKLWETVQLHVDEQLSVVNLSQLTELRVRLNICDLFVSEKVQAFVLSKLPNLQKIELPLPNLHKLSKKDILKERGRIYNWE